MNKGREDKALGKAIEDLPQFSPEDELWGKIEAELEGEKRVKTFRMSPLRWAAILLLPLMAGGTLWVLNSSPVQLSYSEELLPDWVAIPQLIAQDDDFQLFLEEECQPGRDICENPEFKSLMTELQELSNEFNSINVVMDESGNDAFLVKARSRLEKEEVRLKRRIVELLKG